LPVANTSSIGQPWLDVSVVMVSASASLPCSFTRYTLANGTSWGLPASVAAAVATAASIVFSTSAFSLSSDSVRKRRALSSFAVTSVLGQNNPATPVSSRIGLYENE
jgi:hypothetical protein